MKDPKEKADLDNHSNQLNPNNEEYWNSRRLDKPEEDTYSNTLDDEDDYFDDSNDDWADDSYLSDFD